MNQKTTFSNWRPHPWHGLQTGSNPPVVVNAYIEITPFDMMKYEIDKFSGYIGIDRPQVTSSQPPSLYGFIPRTYCAESVSELMRGSKRGDHDPLDICVFSERPINRAGILIEARVIGGIPMIDDGAADDKIVSVLHNDPVFVGVKDIQEFPDILVHRLIHYFKTYKLRPGSDVSFSVGDIYGRTHAEEVIEAAMKDYRTHFPLNADCDN
jgi:inorganic pyrophosphatase